MTWGTNSTRIGRRGWSVHLREQIKKGKAECATVTSGNRGQDSEEYSSTSDSTPWIRSPDSQRGKIPRSRDGKTR